MASRMTSAVGALVLLGVCLPAAAQTVVEFDRRIESVAAVPSGPASGSDHDIIVVWTIVAKEASAPTAPVTEGAGPTDLTSIIQVQTGLLLPAVQKVREVSANTDANPGGCGFGSCSGGCGSGTVDGQDVSLLCLEDPDCTGGGGCDCECRFPSITTVFPNVPLPPGDTITATILPAMGAAPDADAANDAKVVPFDGNPIFWNRRIREVRVAPAAAPTGAEGDSFFDIVVDINVEFAGLTDRQSMAHTATLVVNGQAQAAAPLGCTDWIVAPGDPCEGCTLSSCGTASCAGNPVAMKCRLAENDWGGSFCACVSDSTTLSFPNILLSPQDDDVVVVLEPLPGSLPELPGFGDDDTGELPPPCVLCPGDLDGNGIVDGGDLGLLLLAWGVCFPT